MVTRQLNSADPVDAAAPSTLRPLADGRFHLLRYLGRGSMGTVVEAYDELRGERVAIKLLNHTDAASIYHLKNEFRSLSEMQHTNLVRLHELFAKDDTWFFSMELIDGVAFDRWVRPHGVLDELRLRSAFYQLARAVQALHQQGKLHRDLKPSNVLVDPTGRLVVLDFGMVVDEQLGSGDTLSQREVCGTPFYMAPEQAAGRAATTASDLYAMGVMLFEAITGKLPFAGTLGEVLFTKQVRPAPRASAIVPAVPPDLETICSALLEIAPESRPNDEALLARLTSFAEASHEISAPVQRSKPALVGRTQALNALSSAYEQALREHACVVLVDGPSGIGKTALVDAFIEGVRATRTAMILRARCYEREQLPFKAIDPVVDALTRFVRALPLPLAAATLPRDLAALARLFPSVARLDIVPEVPLKTEVDPLELRQRAFAALHEWISRIRDRQPVIIAIDDFHWACSDSIAVLITLLRARRPAPILLILSQRDQMSESTNWINVSASLRAAKAWSIREITLQPLAAGETQRLITDHADLKRLPRSLVRRIASESRGNPFLARELTNFVLSGGSVDGTASLSALIRARTNVCSEPAQRILEMLALVGKPLEREIALAAADATASDLDALQRAGLSCTSAQTLGRSAVCSHDLIAEQLARDIPPHRARARYARLARELQRHPESDPELTSRCLELSGDNIGAAQHAVLAAQRAESSVALERAATLYQKAIDLGLSPQDEHVACLAALARCMADMGRGSRAVELLLRAADMASGYLQLELQRRAAELLLHLGHIADGWALLIPIFSKLGMAQPSARFSNVDLVFAGAEREPSDAHEARLRLRVLDSTARWTCAFNPSGDQFSERYLELAESTASRSHLLAALCCRLVVLSQNTNDPVATAALAERVRALTPEEPEHTQLISGAVGAAAYYGSDFDVARHHFELVRASVKKLGRRWAIRDAAEIGELMSLAAAGELDVLASTSSMLLRTAVRENSPASVAMRCGGTRALAWLALDDVRAYRAQLLEARVRWVCAKERQAPTDLYGKDTGWSARLDADVQELEALSRELPRSAPHLYKPDLELFIGEVIVDLYEGRFESAYAHLLKNAWSFRSLTAVGASTESAPRWTQPWLAIYRGECLAALLRSAADPSFVREYREGLVAVVRTLNATRCRTAAAIAPALEAALALHDRKPERCVELLRSSLRACEDVGLQLFAAAARRRLGQHVGGDEGAALIEQAEGWMRRQGIRKLEAMTEMHCAGLRV